MSVRKRKLSNTNISVSYQTADKCKNVLTVGPSLQPTAVDDSQRNFFLALVDANAAGSGGTELESIPCSRPTTLQQSTQLTAEESSKAVSPNLLHVPANQAIPLPPPLPSGNLKAAGILAELLSLQNCTDSEKAKTAAAAAAKSIACQNQSSSDEVLERFPNKLHTGSTASQSANVHPSGGLVVTSKANASKKSSSIEDDDESTYLLSCLDDLNLSNEDKEKQNKEDVNRNMFVQELLLSMLSSENDEETKITPKPESDMERAVPVDCPLLASSPPRLLSAADSSADKLSMSTPKPSADSVDNEAPSIEKRKSTSNSESNNDTGMGSSIHTDNANSMAEFSVSSQEYNQRRLGDVSSHSDEACDRDRESSEWRSSPNPIASHYRDVSDDDEKDDNKPPSPTPTQQRLGLHLQSRVYSSGTVHLAGGVSSSAPIAGFGRDDVTSGNLNKHIH